MAYSRIRDFMFCEMCGTLLSYKNLEHVACPLCKSKKPVKDIAKKRFVMLLQLSLTQDIQRELGISSSFDDFELEKDAKQMDYNAKCKTCQHVGMSYVTMQTRSADEGQTIFYTCPKCGSKQTENS